MACRVDFEKKRGEPLTVPIITTHYFMFHEQFPPLNPKATKNTEEKNINKMKKIFILRFPSLV